MFAVIRTGSKQYLVQPGDTIKIEKIDVAEGKKTTFKDVLLFVNDKKEAEIGTPLVKGVKVEAEVVEHGKAKKVVVFKYKSKKRYARKRGHRQPYTKVKITNIAK